MDNLTHTLVGLALARSGLGRASRFGTATLVVGANLPDLDGLAYLVGSNQTALAFRRGWTHGILAMAVLPPLLALLMGALGRRFRDDPARPGIDLRGLLVLAAIGIWSHPLLDLLNVYGVRLLMPFSEHWFTADALFILDPWMWVVLLGGIGASRIRGSVGPARVAVAGFAGYGLLMAVAGYASRRIVARQTGVEVRTMAAPVFGTPLRREVLRDLGSDYEVGELALGLRPHYRATGRVPVGRDAPGVGAASHTPEGERFLRWARFPVFEAAPDARGVRVTIRDLRFGRIRGGSWASIAILVPTPGEGPGGPGRAPRGPGS
jgi:inner membrane protein